MEKLNLYESKVKRIKFKTFLILLAVMALPGVALRIYIESEWAHNVKLLSVEYHTVLSNSGIELHGNRRDLIAIDTKKREYDVKSKMIISQQKYLLDFFEKAYLSKKFFKIIYDHWRKDERDWAVMSEMTFDLKKFSLEMYEVYLKGEKILTSEIIGKTLKDLFPLSSTKTLYDVEVFKNMYLRRTVIRGGVAPSQEKTSVSH